MSREVNKVSKKITKKTKLSLAPTCGVIILDNDDKNRKQEICNVCTIFPAILKLFVLSTKACITGCVPKQTGFQTQNARLAIPSKCAHAGRKLTNGVMQHNYHAQV